MFIVPYILEQTDKQTIMKGHIADECDNPEYEELRTPVLFFRFTVPEIKIGDDGYPLNVAEAYNVYFRHHVRDYVMADLSHVFTKRTRLDECLRPSLIRRARYPLCTYKALFEHRLPFGAVLNSDELFSLITELYNLCERVRDRHKTHSFITFNRTHFSEEESDQIKEIETKFAAIIPGFEFDRRCISFGKILHHSCVVRLSQLYLSSVKKRRVNCNMPDVIRSGLHGAKFEVDMIRFI